MDKMHKQLISLFVGLCILFTPIPLYAEEQPNSGFLLNYQLVAAQADRPNLTGFIPMDHQEQYEVKIVDSTDEVINRLLSEEALLGFLSPLEYLKARERGLPLAVIQSPFQIAPIAFAIKKGVFNRNYSSFLGKRVLAQEGSEAKILFQHLLREINLTVQDVIWVEHDPKEHKSYGEADIVLLDNLQEIVKFENKAETDTILYPHEFNINFKGPLLVAKQSIAEETTLPVLTFAKQVIDNFVSNIFNRKNLYSLFLQKAIPFVFQSGRVVGEITEQDWWQMQRLVLEEAQLTKLVSIISSTSTKPQKRPFSMTDIRVALPGLPNPDFAGFYMAEDRGYYGRIGRKVLLKHYPTEASVIEAVRQGQAELGVVSGYSLIKAQYENSDYHLLGVIFQEDPTVFISLEETPSSGDHPAKEIIKQILMISDKSYGTFLSFIDPLPVSSANIRFDEGYPTLFSLIEGRAGVIVGRDIFEDSRVKEYKDRFKVVRNQAFPVVGLSIFTRDSLESQHEKLLKKVVKATFHGYENSIYQGDQTARAVLQRDHSLSYPQVKSVIFENKNFLKDGHGTIGSINLARWRQLTDAAIDKGLIKKEPSWNRFFPQDIQEVWEQA